MPTHAELLEKYRSESTEELQRLASNLGISVDVRAAVAELLRERSVEPNPFPMPPVTEPAPPRASASRQRPALIAVGVGLLAINVFRLCARQAEQERRDRDFAEMARISRDLQAPVAPVAPPSAPAIAPSTAPVAVAAPGGGSVPTVQPKKSLPWQPASGPLSASEKVLVGTWAATVGDDATRSAFMADKVMFGTAGGGLADVVDAIDKGARMKTNCVWLELLETRKGIRRECALVNGEPSALDMTNPMTGAKSDLGTTFEWQWDAKAKAVRFHFDADLLVPSPKVKTPENLAFRTWVLRFGQAVGDEGHRMKESFPEHDLERTAQDVYDIYPGRFVGQR